MPTPRVASGARCDVARSQWLAAVVAVWGLTGAASGVGADEVLRYELTPAFGEGRLHVSLSWQTGRREQSVLVVSQRVGPINDVPAMLENLRFSCGSRRDTGGSWMLTHRPEETVRCDYDVVPGRRAFDDWDNTHYPITTTSFFHGLGTAFLLAPNSGAGVPDEFDVVLRWKPAGRVQGGVLLGSGAARGGADPGARFAAIGLPGRPPKDDVTRARRALGERGDGRPIRLLAR